VKYICSFVQSCTHICDHNRPHEEILLHGKKGCGHYKTPCYLRYMELMICKPIGEEKKDEMPRMQRSSGHR